MTAGNAAGRVARKMRKFDDELGETRPSPTRCCCYPSCQLIEEGFDHPVRVGGHLIADVAQALAGQIIVIIEDSRQKVVLALIIRVDRSFR